MEKADFSESYPLRVGCAPLYLRRFMRKDHGCPLTCVWEAAGGSHGVKLPPLPSNFTQSPACRPQQPLSSPLQAAGDRAHACPWECDRCPNVGKSRVQKPATGGGGGEGLLRACHGRFYRQLSRRPGTTPALSAAATPNVCHAARWVV